MYDVCCCLIEFLEMIVEDCRLLNYEHMNMTGSTKVLNYMGKICMRDDGGGLVKLNGDNGGASHCLCSV